METVTLLLALMLLGAMVADGWQALRQSQWRDWARLAGWVGALSFLYLLVHGHF